MRLMKPLALAVFCAVCACAQTPLQFAGQVSAGEAYSKDFGPGLMLTLSPTGSGWTIGVVPKTPCQPREDWAMVVNPPYRGYNDLYLDTGYGITAQEAVAMSPREFHFLLDCESYKVERQRLEIVLWPHNYPAAVADDALAKLGSSRLGSAKLTILESKTAPAAEEVEGKNYGLITFLRFQVEITLPPSSKSPAQKAGERK